MFLAQPDRVKAQLFGADDEVEGVLIIATLVLAILEKVEQGEQSEFRDASSCCALRSGACRERVRIGTSLRFRISRAKARKWKPAQVVGGRSAERNRWT